MMTLPQGWVETSLGSLADFIMGQAPPGSASNFEGIGTPFVKAGEFGADQPVIREWTTQPLKMASANDVLICVVGATSGKINLGADCAIGRSVAAIRPAAELNQLYLYNFLKTQVSNLRQRSIGTAQGVISKEMLSDLSIPFPHPVEQQRIVAKVESLTAKSACARAELAKINRLSNAYKKALLSKAFLGELTSEWRETRPHLRKVDPRKARDLRKGQVREPFIPPHQVPKHWQWLAIPQIGNLDRGKSRHRPRNDARLFDGPYPFIQTGDVRSAGQYLTEYTQTYSEFGLAQSRLWRKGTVCITIAANIAETSILGIDACFPDSVVGFVPFEECTCPEYVEYFIRTIRSDLELYAPSTAQKNINLDVLYSVHIPTPPLEEQHEIIRRVEAAFAKIDCLAAEAKRALELTDRLDEKILVKAFRGELVPQDPNDEPASVLLDRIRAERAVQPKAKRGRKAAGT